MTTRAIKSSRMSAVKPHQAAKTSFALKASAASAEMDALKVPAKKTGTRSVRSIAAAARGTVGTAQKIKAPLDATAATKARQKTDSKAKMKGRPSHPADRVVGLGGPALASKGATVMTMLQQSDGTTLDALQQVTGWQAHSVRGFLSGTVRKKLGEALVSDRGEDGVRRYRITGTVA